MYGPVLAVCLYHGKVKNIACNAAQVPQLFMHGPKKLWKCLQFVCITGKSKTLHALRGGCRKGPGRECMDNPQARISRAIQQTRHRKQSSIRCNAAPVRRRCRKGHVQDEARVACRRYGDILEIRRYLGDTEISWRYGDILEIRRYLGDTEVR